MRDRPTCSSKYRKQSQLLDRSLDHFEDDITAADYDIIRDSQYVPTMRTKPKVSFGIVRALLRTLMRRPIEFNDQLGFYANEIGDIAADGNLPPKLPFKAAIAQAFPKHCLGCCHRAP